MIIGIHKIASFGRVMVKMDVLLNKRRNWDEGYMKCRDFTKKVAGDVPKFGRSFSKNVTYPVQVTLYI